MATAVTPRPSVTRAERPTFIGPSLRALPPGIWARLGLVVGAVVVLTGCALRFVAPSGLWLDEVLSVNISRLPVTQIPGGLVDDGSPPLYYYLLHYWMELFGQGDLAVRALSGVISVATLPLLWAAGRRAGGRRTAWAALILAASSPWAIYYATDTRPYSAMALEAVLFYLVVNRALEFPARGRLVAVALVTAALMYTHYWDLYLVGTVGLWALWRAWRERRTGRCPAPAYPQAAAKVAWAMVGGGVLFLPWAPVFLAQLLHTGTPWTTAPSPYDMLLVLTFFGGVGHWGAVLTFLLFALVGLALFARPGPASTAVVLEPLVQARSRFVALSVVGTLGVAVLAGLTTGAAFDSRYIAVVFPLFIVLCALGVSTFGSRRVTSGFLAIAVVCGIFSAREWNSQPRTQAVRVAAELNSMAQPGDMVVYCPDQLGPSVDRLLNVPNVTELTFPRMTGPQRVDWWDYDQVIKDTSVYRFASSVISKLNPGSTLWLVWRNGYGGFGNDCGELQTWLSYKLGGGYTVVRANQADYEYENLTRISS